MSGGLVRVIGWWKSQKDVGRRKYRKSRKDVFFSIDVYFFCIFFKKTSRGSLKIVGRWKFRKVVGRLSVDEIFDIFFEI